jgi:protein SCO1/2
MLKFRSIVGITLSVLIVAGFGLVYWLNRPSSILEEMLEATPPPLPDTVFVGDELVPPVPVPEFDLINHSGIRVTNKDLEGKVVLLSFAYTSCPDTCPVMFGRFLNVQREFGDAIGDDIEMAFISVDPEVDTPERLKNHSEAMKSKWLFLTEEPEVMEEVWKAFRVYVEKEGGGLVSHTNLTYLIDQQGLVRVEYMGLPPDSVFVSDVQKVLAGE